MNIAWRLSPFLVVFFGVVGGVFVLVWAHNIGIFSYRIPADVPFWLPGKEVGFALAWNWTFALLLMPVSVALAILIIQRTRQALLEMHARDMIVDDRFRPVTRQTLERIWRILAVGGALAAVVITALSVWFALDRHEATVGQHFDHGTFRTLAQPIEVDGVRYHPPTATQEFDWSVAALIDRQSQTAPNGVVAEANRNFSLVVYVGYLGLFMAAIFTVVVWMLIMTAAASLTLFERPGVRLVPSVRSTDPRRGFESLESTFVLILVAVFIAYFAAYLVVTQNIYLRTDHVGWGDLFFGAVGDAAGLYADQGLWTTLLMAVGFIATDRAAGSMVDSFDAILAAMAGALVLVVSMSTVLFVLRLAARHGKASLERHRGQSLPAIKIWPLEWPGVTDFVIAIFLATLALFLYRLGALLFLAAVLLALYRLWRISRKSAVVP